MNRGKAVILTMVLVGVFLAAFAWWARYSRSLAVLENLGREAVIAIRTGEKVELLKLGPVGETAEDAAPPSSNETIVLAAGDASTSPILGVLDTRDITKSPGLIHARHHLVHEKGYAWDEARPENYVPAWESAMRFTDDEITATMLLDLDSRRCYFVESGKEFSLQPILTDALQKFFATVP